MTGTPSYKEGDAFKALAEFAGTRGEDPSTITRRHGILHPSTGLGGTWPTLLPVTAPPGIEAISADFEQTAPTGKYFIVTSKASGVRRLHLAGCYVKPQNCHRVQFVDEASLEDVDAVCKDCRARCK